MFLMGFVSQLVSLGVSSLIGMYIEIARSNLAITTQPFA